MNKVNLDEIKVYFPQEPFDAKKHFLSSDGFGGFDSREVETYLVFASWRGFPIARLTIRIPLEPNDINDFWFNMNDGSPKPRPVVTFQDTENKYWGQGISGGLITLANKTAKSRFKEPLASDIVFSNNYSPDRRFHQTPARRVWEKLEKEGLAYQKPFMGKPRWIML